MYKVEIENEVSGTVDALRPLIFRSSGSHQIKTAPDWVLSFWGVANGLDA
ncbi:MAG: hypothetical protein IJD09_01445 [Clostridia bacterium]|nr:hypothetical protein [Clostridia bacterium]